MELADLKKIGLTDGEIKIYDALLELGETTRTQLAKKSGISPSKIYDVANRLLEKGIISSVKKNGVIHFAAADPSRIQAFLDHKEQEIRKEKALVDELLPTLLLKYQKTQDKSDVEVFYGWEGMKTCFDDIVKILEPGEWNYVFGASSGHDSVQADLFFSQYYRKKKSKGYGTMIIFNEDMRKNEKRFLIFKEIPNSMRFLHTDTFTEINLYRNKVLIIMLLQKPIIIRVTSQEAADSFKKFFDTMWDLAKP